MIRFSLVINNQKNEYLICECPLSEAKIGEFEFLGGEIDIETLPSFEWLKKQMENIVYEKIGVEIDNCYWQVLLEKFRQTILLIFFHFLFSRI